MLAAASTAQGAEIDSIVHSFTHQDGLLLTGFTFSDDRSVVYGIANGGGANNMGTVYGVHTDGTQFKVLHTFSGSPTDGNGPYGAIVRSGNWLYMTTFYGGAFATSSTVPPNAGDGTVYAVNTQGDSYAAPILVHSFGGSPPGWSVPDGIFPSGGLILGGPAGTTLFGTTSGGGWSGMGTVFSVDTAGQNFNVLHSFGQGSGDGVLPGAPLLAAGSWLYGTTQYGGAKSSGTLFAVTTTGDGNGALPPAYQRMYSFSALSPHGINKDGANPQAPLILVNGFLYGTASQGGVYGAGTVFAFKLNTGAPIPTAALSWHTSFPGSGNSLPQGGVPAAGLAIESDFLWSGPGHPNGLYLIGTTSIGGDAGGNNSGGGLGTVFTIKSDGTGLVGLADFGYSLNQNGLGPEWSLFGTYNNGFYGTTWQATLFHLNVRPTMQSVVTPLGLKTTWEDPPNFVLQSAPTVSGPWTNIVGATSPYTNALSGSQQFFRLQGSLTSPPDPPTVNTFPAFYAASNSAWLEGSVSPNGADATAWFEYGASTNYDESTATMLVNATDTNNWMGLSNLVNGLVPGTAYHCQLVASNSTGLVTGGDVTFGTVYAGNSLTVSNGAPDGGTPLVILGEYSPAGPLATSTVTLPAGTVQDVKFYGQNYNFTLYALSYITNGPGTNKQTFQVVASQSFSGTPTNVGIQSLAVSNFSVYAGSLLAFAGKGPYYPQMTNDAYNSDATYEDPSNPNSSIATPPGGPGATFSVGIYSDTNATYGYITDSFSNQGRTYGIGVDVWLTP